MLLRGKLKIDVRGWFAEDVGELLYEVAGACPLCSQDGIKSCEMEIQNSFVPESTSNIMPCLN